ncbi:Y4yA family PLP-dependent enzyme [Nocardia donostiensis]|uniref:Decarboxylase n=1 Tax=Nocardia donostiensis TaxID=1538463 RepID=A0A1W0AYQ9_9NOCA|nr:Y4yA family PLP-dependent enzyme [Nocardia donostiensis]ONM49740.1 decarboxylase [Nocardia donostiensis]OQS15378.1 decarboxylase [Nocardia donostiensis]OQS19833.1 decarboxylase [Nocardia donostiensis]
MTDSPPALPARWHPLVRAYLDDPIALAAVLARYGSPVHLVFPQVFADNLDALRAVFDDHPVGYRICYAHKVNKSQAFVRTAAAAGIAVDVASPQELASAGRAGFPPDRIEVTGPKGEAFLRQLTGSGVTVNIDNLWELQTLAELVGDVAPVPVLLRVSGFTGTQVSRFGVPLRQVGAALKILSRYRDRLTFLGPAFHLDSGETSDRLRAVGACLTLVEQAYEHGLSPSVLDIGGGLRQVFTADADEFDRYVLALRAALTGRGEPMSWGNNTFGYQIDGAKVRGTPVFHKYANTVAAQRMLADLLAAPLEGHGGRSVAQVAADNLLDIWVEPGKALVDHAGATVARVEFVKEAADGSVLVAVDLSRDSVTPADQEVMVDPLVLPGERPPSAAGAPVGVYFAGRLCLERDLITNHKVWLPWLPRPGDLVVFPNTAGYHMDLSAAGAAMHPLPEKVAVSTDGAAFRMCPDADYSPEAN